MAPARGRRLARSSRSGRRPRRPRELAPGRHAPEELPLLGVLTHRSSIPLSASARTSAPRRGTGGGGLASEATSASGGRRQAGSLRNLVDRVPTPVPLAKGSRFELANDHGMRGLRARRRAHLRRAAKTAARCRGAHDPVGRRRRGPVPVEPEDGGQAGSAVPSTSTAEEELSAAAASARAPRDSRDDRSHAGLTWAMLVLFSVAGAVLLRELGKCHSG